jgi:hypothetical protein
LVYSDDIDCLPLDLKPTLTLMVIHTSAL